MYLNQRGQAFLIGLITGVFIIIVLFAIYSLNNSKKANQEVATLKSSPASTAQPKKVVNNSTSPMIKPTPSVTSVLGFTKYKDVPSLPSDFPIYKGAEPYYVSDAGPCNSDPNRPCETNTYVYAVPGTETSTKDVINWYVTNPVPGWTYEGDIDPSSSSQFGNLTNNGLYYRLVVAQYTNPTNFTQLAFFGPLNKRLELPGNR